MASRNPCLTRPSPVLVPLSPAGVTCAVGVYVRYWRQRAERRRGGAGGGADARLRGRVPVDRQLWALLAARGGDPANRQLQAMMMMGTDRDFGPEDYEMLLALDEHTPTKMIARASRGEISRLPTIKYAPPKEDPSDPAKTKEEARTRCLVCLEDFVPGETLRLLPCIHFFHAKCIDRWLGEKAECPVCKSSIRESSDGGARAAP